MNEIISNCKHDFTQNWGYIHCPKCTMIIFSSDKNYKALKEVLSAPAVEQLAVYKSL